MPVARQVALQTLTHPTGITFRPEERRAVIIIDACDVKASFSKEHGYFGTD
jgi:uncharacterized protein YbbC (DUF1343 family)